MSKAKAAILAIPNCQKVTIVEGKEYQCQNMCQEKGDLHCLWHKDAVRFGFSLITQQSSLELEPRQITDEEREMFFHVLDVRGMDLPTGNQQYSARLGFGMRLMT